MKFKKPTLKQVIFYIVILFIASVTISMFLGSIKALIGLAFLLFAIWASYRLYKSTPAERIRWGKKNKFLGLFFKETQSE